MTAELLDLAQSIAIQAGEFARDRRRTGVSVAATKSSELDVVTLVDRETEELIRALIRQSRPDDAVFGEEGGGVSGSSGLTWVVDPIDGTVNFLYDLPQWAISIAVVEGEADPAHWRPRAGAVYNPSTEELFSASADGPADLNGRPIEVNHAAELSHALINTGFSYDRAESTRQAAVLAELLGEVRDIRRMGAASLDLCFVACGRVDAYFEANTNPWDFAAGALIVERAGGRAAGLGGAPLGRSMVLAAPEPLFGQLDERLSALGAARLS